MQPPEPGMALDKNKKAPASPTFETGAQILLRPRNHPFRGRTDTLPRQFVHDRTRLPWPYPV